MISDTESDTPLATRTKKANNAKADVWISFHANANTAQWGSWGGIETFAYKAGTSSARLGKLVNDRLVKASGLRDRGVKYNNLHETRETSMDAILIEAGFMDNREECELLKSDSYRRLVAKETCKALCEWWGVPYKGDSQPPVQPQVPNKPAEGVSFPNGDYNCNFICLDDLNARAGRPDSNNNLNPTIIHTFKKGDVFYGGYCLNNWMGVSVNGKQAFVNATYLKKDVPNVPSLGKPWKNGDYKSIKAKVTADVLNVRKGRPNQANYNTVLTQLKQGQTIELHYCLDGWFSVYVNGANPGFISGDFVQLI